MDKETLIKKWLDGELTPTELKAFKQLEEAEDYIKLSETASYFQAPDFDTTENYERLQTKLTHTKKTPLTNILLKIAAVFVLAFGAYLTFFSSATTSVKTLAGNTEKILLPDQSKVMLNAVSTLQFDKDNWKNKREVHLEGEAFFKVEKGKHFDVVTPAGTITVVGTQFNVKQRPDYFEVTCYEGLVQVKTAHDTVLLKAGERFRIPPFDTELSNTTQPEPSWINAVSSFESVPFSEVLAEFQRQYKLEVRLKNRTFDTTQLFTGSFSHDNLERALQSITVPFNLTYTVNDEVVILEARD